MTERPALPPLAPVEARPAPARRGKLSICTLCQTPVAAHFDTEGEFIGCVEADADTVFVLTPTTGARPLDHASQPAAAAEHAAPSSINTRPRKPRRGAQRFRNFPARRLASEDIDRMTARRRKVWKALEAIHEHTRAGVLTREIAKRAGLPESSASECLDWLNKKHYIRRESADTDGDPSTPKS